MSTILSPEELEGEVDSFNCGMDELPTLRPAVTAECRADLTCHVQSRFGPHAGNTLKKKVFAELSVSHEQMPKFMINAS
jgi:hypothetical protein